MAKTKNTKASEKIFTLFQHKTFTIFFFIGIIALLGGAFYLMQSSAYSSLSVRNCTVSGKGVSKGFTVDVLDSNTSELYGRTTANNKGAFSVKLHGVDQANTAFDVYEYTTNKGGGGPTGLTVGPCR